MTREHLKNHSSENVQQMAKASERLEQIEGIEESTLDDWNRSKTSGVIFAEVESDGVREAFMNDSRKKTYELSPNLRSVSRLIRSELESLVEDGAIRSYRITSRPEKQYNEPLEGEYNPAGYNQVSYEIDVWV